MTNYEQNEFKWKQERAYCNSQCPEKYTNLSPTTHAYQISILPSHKIISIKSKDKSTEIA